MLDTKRGLFSSVLVAVLGLFLIVSTALPVMADSYTTGKAYYHQKKYPEAMIYLNKAIKEKPSDAKRVFYFANASAKAGKMDTARQAFQMLMQMLPASDPMAQKAQANLAILTKAQITQVSSSGKANQVMKAANRNAKTNYLPYVISHGKIVRFNKRNLKVYVEAPRNVKGYTTIMHGYITRAKSVRNRPTNGALSIRYTNYKHQADIVVTWQQNFKDNILGVSPYQFVGDMLVRSDVTLATYYPGGQVPIPTEELKATIIHEFGHAIGIKGHSPYEGDLMYYASNKSQSARLTTRDTNTIRLLYKMEADVSNAGNMSASQTQKYLELYKKGVEYQQVKNYPQAIAYYRQALRLSDARNDVKYNLGGVLINQGNQYIKQKNYNAAKQNYQEAVTLFSQVQNSDKPIPGTDQNLSIAKKNLSILDKM